MIMRVSFLGLWFRLRSDVRRPRKLEGLKRLFPRLFSELEPLDELAVFLEIFPLQVSQKAPPRRDELEEAPARVVVLQVELEVLAQRVDSLREDRDLHLTGAGVFLIGPKGFNDSRLCFLGEWHEVLSVLLFGLLVGDYYTGRERICKEVLARMERVRAMSRRIRALSPSAEEKDFTGRILE